MPIGQRQAQPRDVQVSGPYLRFDGRDFGSAASDSCGLPVTFLGDLSERATIPVEHRIDSEVVTIPLADHVHVSCFKFDQKRPSMMFCRRDKCPPDPGKGVENDLMRIGGIEDRLFHEGHGLGRRMERTRLRPENFPNCILIARGNRVMRRARCPAVIDRLVAVVVIHPSHYQRVFDSNE